jgi:hypothetical protein
MRKVIRVALRSALKDWAVFGAALVATAAGAQSMSPPGPIKTPDADLKHPGLVGIPSSGKQPKCIGRTIPVDGLQVDPSLDCPPILPATNCFVGAQRCSDASKAAGRMVPL